MSSAATVEGVIGASGYRLSPRSFAYPIVCLQANHAAEMSLVVCNERAINTRRMCGDHRIVDAYWRAKPQQLGLDASELVCSGHVPREHRAQSATESCDALFVLGGAT